ncbi:MAG TPA: hypothetical protein VFE96_09420, partial [Candidatus Bathyarchaeia archaeon]|nr:hypothetical protein [Candidatus Bathyarchaeia archaeon]
MTFPEATNWQPAISENVQLRSGTDVEIPAIWLLSALASYLAWASFAIFLWLGGLEPTATTTIGLGLLGIQLGLTLVLGLLGIIGLAVSAWSAHLVYTLLNRINAHSA